MFGTLSDSAGARKPIRFAARSVGEGGRLRDAVDALIESGLLRRVLAMVDIAFSNSMIEAWWRSLKYNWAGCAQFVAT